MAITTFSQADLDAGLVIYVHDGSDTTSDSYTLLLSDGQGTSEIVTVNVTIDPVNQPPGIIGDLGITVDEGGSVTVTTDDLNETDPDDDGAELVYTITDQPDNGQLELTTDPGVAITSFTQADLDAGLVVYVHDGSETTSDSYEVSLADGGESGSTPATATIDVTINPVNDPPGITGDLGIEVNEGGTVALTTADLDETDPDDDGAELVYTITDQPDNGRLELNTEQGQGVAITSFTQADLEAGLVIYVHDGSDTTSDSYEVSLSDGSENESTATVNVTINPVNDPPEIIGDLGITVDEGGTVALTTADLDETDPDDDGAELTYTITDQPDHGQLELTTGPGVAISSFTQADLDAGLVVYVHDGSETTSDSYEVSLADGGENGSTPATATIDVTINPVVDVITGTPGEDDLAGTIGDDIINLLESDDVVSGSAGNDQIDGGEGEDEVDYSGIATQDIVINLVDGTVTGAEIGFDTIANIERFVAGSGNDRLDFAVDTGFFFDGGDGVDTVRFIGGVDINAETTDIEIENVEIIDLNDDPGNTLTIAADDVADANEAGMLTILGARVTRSI